MLLILPLGLARIYENITEQVPEPLEALARYTSPFQVVNSYGLFAVMTKRRPEIILEGSEDGVNWREYEFKWKPGDVKRAPVWMQKTGLEWIHRLSQEPRRLFKRYIVHGLPFAVSRIQFRGN